MVVVEEVAVEVVEEVAVEVVEAVVVEVVVVGEGRTVTNINS